MAFVIAQREYIYRLAYRKIEGSIAALCKEATLRLGRAKCLIPRFRSKFRKDGPL